MNEEYFAGLDLGQSQDFTALAVVERVELTGERDAVTWAFKKTTALRLRHLERLPLGTPYPDMVERTSEVMNSRQLADRSHLAVDATGVGRPVVDLLRRKRMPCRLWPVLITGGEVETQGEGFYRVPKRDLIVGLQVTLQSGELQIAAGMKEGPTLVRELLETRVKVTASGHEQFGAWREGEHDDLVLAVALACWTVKKAYPNTPHEGGYWKGEERLVW